MSAADGKGVVGAHGRQVYDDDLGRPRCTADAKGRLREGATAGSDAARCSNRPPAGATTCRFHGSRAPQTERARRLRLMDLQDPATARLARILANPATTDRDALRAIQLIYDRTGLIPGVAVDVATAKDRILDRLSALVHDGQDDDDG